MLYAVLLLAPFSPTVYIAYIRSPRKALSSYCCTIIVLYVIIFAKRDHLGAMKTCGYGLKEMCEVNISRNHGLLHRRNFQTKFEARTAFLRVKRRPNSFSAEVIVFVYGLYRKCNADSIQLLFRIQGERPCFKCIQCQHEYTRSCRLSLKPLLHYSITSRTVRPPLWTSDLDSWISCSISECLARQMRSIPFWNFVKVISRLFWTLWKKIDFKKQWRQRCHWWATVLLKHV